MQFTHDYVLLKNLLSAQQLAEMDQLMMNAQYVDGKATASSTAKEVKNNLQLNLQQQHIVQPLQHILLQAFNQSQTFQQLVLPKNIHAPLFSVYEQGMHYGWHVDSPLMGYPPVRTDVAMTVFLEHPENYEGGELEIQFPTGVQLFKLPKGDAVCYPCQYVHQVKEVHSGQRKAAVTWIQSFVRNTEQRAILSQLWYTHQELSKAAHALPQNNTVLQVYSNLMRMWSDV